MTGEWTLIDCFRDGIEKILKYLEVEHLDIHEIIIEHLSEEPQLYERRPYKIEYNFFVNLTKRTWFKDNVKYVDIPVSNLGGGLSNLPLKKKKVIFISDDIIELFREKFPIDFKQLLSISEHNSYSPCFFDSEHLFYSTFFEIFHRYINEKSEIADVLDTLIQEWKNFLDEKLIPIQLRLNLNQVVITTDFKEDDKFQLIHSEEYFIQTKNSSFYKSFSGIVYKTKIRAFLYNTEEDLLGVTNNELIEEYSRNYSEIKNFLSTMYLYNYEISNIIPKIEHPWWSPYKYEPKLIEHKQNFYNPRDFPKKLNIWDFRNILKMYTELKNKNIFNENCFPLNRSLMELALSQKSDIDRVFDAHILLEFLFGPGFQGELNFRVSMNASIFISNNVQEFEKHFYFFKSLYGLRSAAIHGGDWVDRADKILKKLNQRGWQFSNIGEMFDMMENIIRDIIKKLTLLDISISKLRDEVNKNPLYYVKRINFLFNKEGIDC